MSRIHDSLLAVCFSNIKSEAAQGRGHRERLDLSILHLGSYSQVNDQGKVVVNHD